MWKISKLQTGNFVLVLQNIATKYIYNLFIFGLPNFFERFETF